MAPPRQSSARSTACRALVCLAALFLLAQPLPAQSPAAPRRAPRPPRISLRVTRDLAYAPGPGASHRLDLYFPPLAPPAKSPSPGKTPPPAKRLPLIVWIHGGGWQEGNKNWVPDLSLLLSRGYAVASINYRLSTQAAWPAQLDDCRAAIRYLRSNAARYGLDPSKIGVWGESAGGHLASLLGTNTAASETVSSRVQAVCAWSAPTDLFPMAILSALLKSQTGEDPVGDLVGGPAPQHQKELAEASPVRHASADDPPFLLMHGKSDLVVPWNQSEMLAAALQKAGVPVQLYLYESVGHADDFFLQPAQMNRVLAFFDACLLRGEGNPATRPAPAK